MSEYTPLLSASMDDTKIMTPGHILTVLEEYKNASQSLIGVYKMKIPIQLSQYPDHFLSLLDKFALLRYYFIQKLYKHPVMKIQQLGTYWCYFHDTQLVSFSPNNKQHIDKLCMLHKLFSAIYKQDNCNVPKIDETTDFDILNHSDWEIWGFQGFQPGNDFRAGGVLALNNLLYITENYPEFVNDILTKNKYPFATASINITFITICILNFINQSEIYRPFINKYFSSCLYTYLSTSVKLKDLFILNAISIELTKFDNLFIESVDNINASINCFINKLYAYLLKLFNKFWETWQPSKLLVGHSLSTFQASNNANFNENPNALIYFNQSLSDFCLVAVKKLAQITKIEDL